MSSESRSPEMDRLATDAPLAASGFPLASLATLREAGFFEPLDVHFARHLLALAGASDESVALAAALVSRQTRAGHVCVPLDRFGSELVVGESGPLGCVWPDTREWRRALEVSALVSRGAERRPLVLDEQGRLYLHRYHEHEVRLAALLRARAVAPPRALEESELASGLTRLFGDAGGEDGQRRAARVALERPLAVISGGPGTGKTSTVVRILALLAEQALSRAERPPRVLLLAPTGKAAARLVESIRSAKGQLALPVEVSSAIVEEASTIHRALGVTRESASRYLRNAHRPLVADVVLVDEASMVDLALMRHLVEAVPREARLILLGDRHQLASVEAGSVLAELCAAPEPLARSVVELTKSYRFRADSAIASVSAAVRAGVVAGVFEGLSSEPDAELTFSNTEPARELSPALRKVVVEGYRPCMRAKTVEDALRLLGQFRVLAAHRRGYAGVEHLNEVIRRALVDAGLVPPRGPFYRGRPVLVTQNDYGVGLFNGDVGLTWPNGSGKLRVYFQGADGKLRELSPARLPAHETAFTLSVHKSQGSEHDEIAIVLPQAGSPLLTRELLYTAITRAKRRVRLFGTREAIESAVRQGVVRESGLCDALAAPLEASSDRV